jgi:predicted phage terminase large subunit-like protein
VRIVDDDDIAALARHLAANTDGEVLAALACAPTSRGLTVLGQFDAGEDVGVANTGVAVVVFRLLARDQVTNAPAKASGQSLLQDLRLARVPAIGYNPGNADKVSRAHQAAPTLELEIIWVPESGKNHGHPVSWASSFMKQLSKFPVAEHDDYVDTFTQAIIYLKNDGWFELPRAKDPDEPKPQKRERVNPYAV